MSLRFPVVSLRLPFISPGFPFVSLGFRMTCSLSTGWQAWESQRHEARFQFGDACCPDALPAPAGQREYVPAPAGEREYAAMSVETVMKSPSARLARAASRGDLPLVIALLKAGADPNGEVLTADETRTSALMEAVAYNFSNPSLAQAIALTLIDAGADVNFVSQNGGTALTTIARIWGTSPATANVMAFLISRGADVTLGSDERRRALASCIVQLGASGFDVHGMARDMRGQPEAEEGEEDAAEEDDLPTPSPFGR